MRTAKTDQTGRIPVFAGRTNTLMVLSCCGSSLESYGTDSQSLDNEAIIRIWKVIKRTKKLLKSYITNLRNKSLISKIIIKLGIAYNLSKFMKKNNYGYDTT